MLTLWTVSSNGFISFLIFASFFSSSGPRFRLLFWDEVGSLAFDPPGWDWRFRPEAVSRDLSWLS